MGKKLPELTPLKKYVRALVHSIEFDVSMFAKLAMQNYNKTKNAKHKQMWMTYWY